MDAHRFDRLARSFVSTLNRRRLMRGLTSAVPGSTAVGFPGMVESKNKRKKPKPNAFGCLNVGQRCGGKSDKCCSGICQGKKPKRGKKDKSTCVAHNVLGCRADQDACLQLGSTCGTVGLCYRTTGQASFCGFPENGACVACQKDADCEALGFPPGTACAICVSCPEAIDTACYPEAA